MSAELPDVGTLVLDKLSGKTGVFMGEWAGQACLRPEGGGTEWVTFPEKVTPVESES